MLTKLTKLTKLTTRGSLFVHRLVLFVVDQVFTGLEDPRVARVVLVNETAADALVRLGRGQQRRRQARQAAGRDRLSTEARGGAERGRTLARRRRRRFAASLDAAVPLCAAAALAGAAAALVAEEHTHELSLLLQVATCDALEPRRVLELHTTARILLRSRSLQRLRGQGSLGGLASS